MRILLLSDIHSNLEALQACLAVAPPADVIVNLGDIVGYGASPNEVTAKARELGGTFVRGNHDKVVTGLDSVEAFNPVAGLAAVWNRDQLASEHLDWLRALPKGPVLMEAVAGVQFVHGAPDDEDQYVVTVEDALETLVATQVAITFFGHTHIQGLFRFHSGAAESIHPEYRQTLNTYFANLEPQPVTLGTPEGVLRPQELMAAIDDQVSCVVVQSPNFFAPSMGSRLDNSLSNSTRPRSSWAGYKMLLITPADSGMSGAAERGKCDQYKRYNSPNCCS